MDQNRDAIGLGQCSLCFDQTSPVPDIDADGEFAVCVFSRLIRRDQHASHALCLEHARHVAYTPTAGNRLSARHRHGPVVEQLEGHVATGGDGGLHGQLARMEVRAIAEILEQVGAIGGTLMGLANLVPGISGATMLLVAGVYPGFIGAIAEVTTFRFFARSLVLLAAIVGTAALAILLLAGPVKGLVEDHRWVMYSLFIGLTLGGVPIVWRMARPEVFVYRQAQLQGPGRNL